MSWGPMKSESLTIVCISVPGKMPGKEGTQADDTGLESPMGHTPVSVLHGHNLTHHTTSSPYR